MFTLAGKLGIAVGFDRENAGVYFKCQEIKQYGVKSPFGFCMTTKAKRRLDPILMIAHSRLGILFFIRYSRDVTARWFQQVRPMTFTM